MHAAEVIRRLHKERLDWRRTKQGGAGPEVSWTLNGIEIAMKIVRQIAHEQHKRHLVFKPRIQRWLAGDMYRATRQALDALNRGDRGRAIKVLQEILTKVEKERTSV